MPGDIPIACTLTAPEQDDRVEEWRQVLGHSVAGAERRSPLELRLPLRDGPADIGTLALLAQKEKACCAFFGFRFEVEADRVTFVMSVPDGAETLLDHFVSMANENRSSELS
jgi:hypothetical protein